MGHKAEDCVEQPVRTMQLNGMHLAAPGLTIPMERTPNGIPAGPRHWSAAFNPLHAFRTIVYVQAPLFD